MKKQTKLKLLISGIIVLVSLIVLAIGLVVVLMPKKSTTVPSIVFNSPQRTFTIFNEANKGDLFGPIVISTSNNVSTPNSIITISNNFLTLSDLNTSFENQLWNLSYVGASWPALTANAFNQFNSNLIINAGNQLSVSNSIGTYLQADTSSNCYPIIQSLAFSTNNGTLLLNANLSLSQSSSSSCSASNIYIGIIPEQTIYISAL